MLVCPKCGVENTLGRVFCVGCGAKLDVGGLSPHDVVRAQKGNVGRRFGRRALILLAAHLVGFTILSLIPRTTVLGLVGTRDAGRAAVGKLKALVELEEGRSLSVDLPEADLNGYLAHFKTQRLKLAALSVSIRDDGFRVRVLRPLKTIRMGSFSFTPLMSYDVHCVPEGKSVRATRGAIGRLPLRGAVAGPVRNALLRLAQGEPDWALVEHLKAVETRQGVLSLTVEK